MAAFVQYREKLDRGAAGGGVEDHVDAPYIFDRGCLDLGIRSTRHFGSGGRADDPQVQLAAEPLDDSQ